MSENKVAKKTHTASHSSKTKKNQPRIEDEDRSERDDTNDSACAWETGSEKAPKRWLFFPLLTAEGILVFATSVRERGLLMFDSDPCLLSSREFAGCCPPLPDGDLPMACCMMSEN